MKIPRLRPIACSILSLASLAIGASAQSEAGSPYFFSTFAGTTGGPDALDGVGSAARFNIPNGVALDQAGNIYVADFLNCTIRKISPTGTVSTIAGTVGVAGSVDGPGSTALFNHPMGLAVDPAGNLFVVDFGNSTIRKISPSGVVSTFAGAALSTGSNDGLGEAARFNFPYDVALDEDGNMYVADLFNSSIRKITPGRVVSTFIDRSNSGLLYPCSLALDAQKNVFVADLGLHTVTKISPSGVATIVAGIPATKGRSDGPGQSATFNTPSGLTLDRLGNVYVSDTNNQTIRKITAGGTVTTFAGTAGASGSAEGRGTEARFEYATDLAADAAGNIYVVDGGAHLVRKITPDAVVTTVAGAPALSGTSDGNGVAARFQSPESVAVDQAGNVYVADTGNFTVRKITVDGTVTTLAGKAGTYGYVDGTGAEARLSSPQGVAVDQAGNVYVADNDLTITAPGGSIYPSLTGSTIRKISPTGVVTTFAGTAGAFGSTDGLGTAARFDHPQGVAVDPAGNVYVADINNAAIRKITPAGLVTTLAHLSGLNNCLTVDGSGTVIVSSEGVVYKITPAGVVTSLAGASGLYGNVDGTGANARFSSRLAVAADSAGNIFAADYNNHTIRKISPAGVVTTVAGKSGLIGNATGVGPEAHFFLPEGIAVDRSGNLYVANTSNHSIRKGQLAGAPVIATQPQSQTVASGSSVQFSVAAGGVPAPTYQWYLNGSAFNGATANTLSFSNVRTTDAGDYTVVVVNSLGSVTSTKATLSVSSSPTAAPAPGSSTGGGGGAIGAWFAIALGAVGVGRWVVRVRR